MKKSNYKIAIFMLGVALIFGGCGSNNTNDTNDNNNITTTEYGMGCILDSDEKFATFPKAKIEKFGANPSSVDLSDKFPTPGSQGAQGSCTAWATAYALKSYLEKVDFGWDQNQKEHQFSPAYVYNQINGGRDEGSGISTALDLIVKQGVCSLATMPYNYRDYTTQPNSTQKAEAAKFKSASWGTVSSGNVDEFKTQLAAGNAIVVGIPVYDDFSKISSSNPIYDNTSGSSRGAHAICLVGYDDNQQAFKLINSWGTNWGINGYGYISYKLMQDLKIKGYVMQDNKHNTDPTPEPSVKPTPVPSVKPTPVPSANPTSVPNGTNLALNKSATASSYYSSEYAPKKAFDGDSNTRWAAKNAYSNQWVTVDLSKNYNISSMRIKWSLTNYPKRYTIYSWDGSRWVSIKTVSSDGNMDEIKFDAPFSGRTISVNCTTPNSSNYVMYECEIYGQ